MSEDQDWPFDESGGDDDDRRRRGPGLRSRMGRLLQPRPLRSLRPGRMKKPGRRTDPGTGTEPWSRGSEEDYYGRPAGTGLAGKPGYGGPAVVKRAGGRQGAGGASAEPDEAEETPEGETRQGAEGEAAEFELDVPDWFGDGSGVEDGLAFEPYGDEGKPLNPVGDGDGLGAVGELPDDVDVLSDGPGNDLGTSGYDLPDWPTEMGPLADDAGATGNSSPLGWPDDLMGEDLGVGAGLAGLGGGPDVPDVGGLFDLGPDPLGTDVGLAFDPQLADLMGPGGVPEIADPFAADPGEGKASGDPFGEDPFAGWGFDKPGNAW